MDYEKLISALKKGVPDEYQKILSQGNQIAASDLQRLRSLQPDYPWQELLSHYQLHKKAQTKFSYPHKLVFTPKGFEQCSSELISEFHGSLASSFPVIADLCCGIGSDLQALAKSAHKVYALDLDHATIACARYNCHQFSNIEFVRQDALSFRKKVDLIFADPDRRINGSRKLHPDHIQPTLKELIDLYSRQKLSDAMLIKLSPAMDYRQVEIDYFSPKGIFPALAHSWDFVSEKGTLKEILLKIGTIADDLPFKAVILPDRNQIAGTGNESVPIKDWQKYVLEPDKAVIRAGLVQKLGKLTDSQLLDKNLAILTADHIPKSSFLRCYYLKKVLPYNKKRLQRYLYEHNIGELIIKTRGFPHSAESERKKFKLKGKNRLIVLIVRRSNHHQAAIIEKI